MLVRQGLPSVKATSWCTKEGEFLRVTLPKLHICSIYRRGGLNQSEADEFDTPIAQDISSLGNSSCLLAGDWNHEPLTSPWNVWALSFAGSLSFPTEKKTESQQDGSSQVIHFPAPTRWESNNCIDWGITKGLKLSLSCFLTNGGITKLSTGHSRALPKPYSPFSGYDPPSISVAPRNATKKTGLTSWKKRGLTPSTISHRIQAGLSYVNMLSVFVSLLLTG